MTQIEIDYRRHLELTEQRHERIRQQRQAESDRRAELRRLRLLRLAGQL